MTTRLGQALLGLINARDDSQLQLAGRCGVSQPNINNIIKGGRPTPDTLKKLCSKSAWIGDPMPGIELLINHLRDEAHRTGRGNEVHVSPACGLAHNLTDLLQQIERLVSIVPSACAPLTDIIGYMLEGVDHAENREQMIAADPPGNYKIDHKRAKKTCINKPQMR